MQSHAQVVVIGGGIIGCSILYHLTKLGWNDVVLLERDELTSGSTWHAAANIHGLHDNSNISRVQHYTMSLYRELEELTGQGCGIFQPGTLYLAQTIEREQQLRLQSAKARYYQLDFEQISRDEAERLHPLVNFDGVRCIMWEPLGGNVDPSGVTHAYANGARRNGASIHRFTPVIGTEHQADGSWIVRTEQGDIRTDIIVNAAGLWAREVARLAGIELPLIPTEHQYFVTEAIAPILAMDRRLPSLADRDGEYYLRQEGQGLLVGAYERDVRFWAEQETPADFGHELFDDDLSRIEENLLRAIERVPALADAGIRRVINGPMIWSPDGNALFGPVPEFEGYFCCNGIIPGFSQSGGLGQLTAEWIVNGEPHLDMFAWDLSRFGNWTTAAFTRARVQDQYANRFSIHFPNQESEAGRPARRRPAHRLQQQELNAVFGLNGGWEHPLWFAREPETRDTVGFTRQNWWHRVGEECRNLRERVGIIDISNFARYRVQGRGAENWLNALFANHMPTLGGHSCLTPLIGVRGGIAGDFLVTRLADEDFLVIGSGMAERFHSRYFACVPRPPSIRFQSCTEAMSGFGVAGPESRTLLQSLCDSSLDTSQFPFMHSRQFRLAGIPVIALRVSFTGDLGWELHCDSEQQLSLYRALLDAGRSLGARPTGSRAMNALRLEKGYGSWSREYTLETWPHEVGMDRLCKTGKPFLNRDAALRVLEQSARERLVLLELDAQAVARSNADASGGEPVFCGDQAVGRVSSGAYGYTVQKSLAAAFVSGVEAGQSVQVMLLGQPHPARVLSEPPFDPKGLRLRA